MYIPEIIHEIHMDLSQQFCRIFNFKVGDHQVNINDRTKKTIPTWSMNEDKSAFKVTS